MQQILLQSVMQYAPTVLIMALTALIPFAMAFLAKNASAADIKKLEIGAAMAYQIVNQMARKTPSTVDDKLAEGVRVMRDQLGVIGKSKAAEERARAALRAEHEKQRAA